MSLNDTHIRSLRAPGDVGKHADGAGLTLVIKPTGATLWRYRYRIDGKENMYAIGVYPEVSLKQARERRDEARKLVRQGIHPAHHRKAEKLRQTYANANTFKAVATGLLKTLITTGYYLSRTSLDVTGRV